MRLTGIILAVLFFGCNDHSNMNSEFVKKFGNESFDEFKNTSMFIRSGDRDGGLIIFTYDNKIPPDLNNGAYIVTVDWKKKKIKSTSCHLMKDSTIADRQKLEKLALKLIEYPIDYLSVDSSNNVFISLRMNVRPDLVRFSNLKYKTDKYKEWKQVKDNWYENKEE
jgi:hypothetical protein